MFHIDDLKKEAYLKFKALYPDFHYTKILKIMSKALGYKSIGHLEREFDFAPDGTFLRRKKEDHIYWPLDVSHYGLLFDVYILMKQLETDYSQALKLKRAIDNHSIFREGYNGNIVYCDITLVETGLEMMVSGNSNRLMGNWPISFYCKRERSYSVKFKGKGKLASFFWFDGFSISDRDIYGAYYYHFIKMFFNLFLAKDNVVFLDGMHLALKKTMIPFDSDKYHKPLYRFIRRTFENHEVEIVDRMEKRSLLLNSLRKDLRLPASKPFHRFT